jgi:hypothetical protein
MQSNSAELRSTECRDPAASNRRFRRLAVQIIPRYTICIHVWPLFRCGEGAEGLWAVGVDNRTDSSGHSRAMSRYLFEGRWWWNAIVGLCLPGSGGSPLVEICIYPLSDYTARRILYYWFVCCQHSNAEATDNFLITLAWCVFFFWSTIVGAGIAIFRLRCSSVPWLFRVLAYFYNQNRPKMCILQIACLPAYPPH